MDRRSIELKWREAGFSCDLWVDPPGQKWEGYVHSVDEMLVLLEGKLELEMDEKKSVILPGQEVYIPANTVHSVRNIGSTTAKWLYGYRNV